MLPRSISKIELCCLGVEQSALVLRKEEKGENLELECEGKAEPSVLLLCSKGKQSI